MEIPKGDVPTEILKDVKYEIPCKHAPNIYKLSSYNEANLSHLKENNKKIVEDTYVNKSENECKYRANAFYLDSINYALANDHANVRNKICIAHLDAIDMRTSITLYNGIKENLTLFVPNCTDAYFEMKGAYFAVPLFMPWGNNPSSIFNAYRNTNIVTFLDLMKEGHYPFAGVWFDSCCIFENAEKDIKETIDTINFINNAVFGVTFVARGTNFWGEKLDNHLVKYINTCFSNRKCPIPGMIYVPKLMTKFQEGLTATYFFQISIEYKL